MRGDAMDTSTVTQKGQVTIPAAVRRKLGLRTGDRVAFVQDGDRVLVQAVEHNVSAAFGLVKSRRSVSLAGMDLAIRTRAGR